MRLCFYPSFLSVTLSSLSPSPHPIIIAGHWVMIILLTGFESVGYFSRVKRPSHNADAFFIFYFLRIHSFVIFAHIHPHVRMQPLNCYGKKIFGALFRNVYLNPANKSAFILSRLKYLHAHNTNKNRNADKLKGMEWINRFRKYKPCTCDSILPSRRDSKRLGTGVDSASATLIGCHH